MTALWELRVSRKTEQTRNGKRRLVGRYQVFHDGRPAIGLHGAIAESLGPRATAPVTDETPEVFCAHVINDEKYATIGYSLNANPAALQRPGLLFVSADQQRRLLLHPARGFCWSVGTIHLASKLDHSAFDIDFADSRARTIALIDDLRAFVGFGFPTSAGSKIPRAKIMFSGRAERLSSAA
jgi:hypothetical protein